MVCDPSWKHPRHVGRPACSRWAFALALLGSLWPGGVLPGGVARAAQTNIAISMTAPPTTARILGPKVFAAKPGSPFLYTIAATGRAPLTFAATGLPAGLALVAASGTLSGTMPAAGSYPVEVTVTSGTSTAKSTLTLISGDTLSLSAPMGWNSYDSFGGGVTEAEVIAAATAQKAQLQPFGWNYVVVDYLWFDPEQLIDANGRYLPSPSRFPSATGTLGLKPLADRVHAMGLNFGIHIMRGISRKTYTANSPILGTAFTATNAGNPADPCPWDAHMWGVRGDTPAGQAWYDSIFAQYAQWGIDFVKVDDMINNHVVPLAYHQAEVQAIRQAIDKTGRSIVFSLSPGPMQPADVVHLNANANMWRMVDDFWDVNGLSTIPDVFTASAAWTGLTGLAAGHWPDADMLPLGYLGPRCPTHPSGATAFTHNEQVTVMSLWSILPSPLMFGGNVPALTTDPTGPFTLALLTNEEVLAVQQDAAGTHGKRVVQEGTTEVWARDLVGGRKAVALFNRGTQDATVSVNFAQLGLSGTPAVRDLWHRADATGMTSDLSAMVPYNGALMYTLTPVGADTADAGRAGDATSLPDARSSTDPGDASAPPSAGGGGAAGTGGGSGMSGSGAGGSGPAEGSAGTEGMPAGGGTGGVNGNSGPGAGSGGGSSGCTCALGVGSGPSSVTGGLTIALAAAGLAARRRRARPWC